MKVKTFTWSWEQHASSLGLWILPQDLAISWRLGLLLTTTFMFLSLCTCITVLLRYGNLFSSSNRLPVAYTTHCNFNVLCWPTVASANWPSLVHPPLLSVKRDFLFSNSLKASCCFFLFFFFFIWAVAYSSVCLFTKSCLKDWAKDTGCLKSKLGWVRSVRALPSKYETRHCNSVQLIKCIEKITCSTITCVREHAGVSCGSIPDDWNSEVDRATTTPFSAGDLRTVLADVLDHELSTSSNHHLIVE